MRRLFIALLAALATMAAMAQSEGRIYVEDFDIAPDSTATVEVLLTNVEATRGVQFKMTLPQGLEIEDMELTKYSRKMKMSLANNQKANNWMVAVYSMSLTVFPPDTAKAVMTLTLTAKPGFEGGDIIFNKSMGSNEDYITKYYDDSATKVLCREPEGTH